MNIKWHEYTWYSKTLAALFFIIVLPLWTFYLGQKYQELIDIRSEVNHIPVAPITDVPTAATSIVLQ